MPRSIAALETTQKCPKPGANGKMEKTMTHEEIKECYRTGEAVTDPQGNDYVVTGVCERLGVAKLQPCDYGKRCVLSYSDLEHAL